MYQFNYQISLSDTDAAGVVFFSQYYLIFHRCYEELLRTYDLSLSSILKLNIALPIQESGCTYFKPIYLDTKVSIQLVCTSHDDCHYTLEYFMYRDTSLVAKGYTKHCCISKDTHSKVLLPDKLRSIIISLVHNNGGK